MRHSPSPPSQAEDTPSGPADAEVIPTLGPSSTDRPSRLWFRLRESRSSQVVVAFTVFLLVLLWGTVTYQLHYDETAVVDAARTNTDNLARAYAEHVLGTVRLLDQMLLRIRDGYEKMPADADLPRRLREAANIEAGALLVQMLDEHGNVMASTLSALQAPLNFADRQYFRVHQQSSDDTLYISPPIVGRITGKHTVVVLSRPLRKANGAFGGIVYVSFDPQYLSGFFTDLAIGRNSTFAIIGRDMTVRDMIKGSGRVESLLGKSVAHSQLEAEVARAPNGDYESASVIDGVPRLFAYRSFADFPLIVVAGIARDDVLADFRERKAWLIAVAAALSLIFVAVALFQLRRIGSQIRAEHTLRQTQHLLVESQRVARLGYVLHDVPNGRLYWSDSLFELRRVPRRPWFSLDESMAFIHEEDLVRHTRVRDAAITARRAFSVDVRVRRPDGTQFWEHRVGHPHFDETGRMVGVLMVIQDITERKENEIELALSRDKMVRAQHVAALGSFERDLMTRKVEWSDQMYGILGLKKGHVVPGYEPIRALVHPDDRDKFQAARDAGVGGIVTATLEFRIIRPDGAERTIYRENGLVFDENNKPIRLYGSYQDVTDRRAAEERERELERKLMHSQKLEALGTLAGGIAHDLNNTLTPIMALSKITARRLDAGTLDRANLETIFSASEQARDLVKRVLAFSRREKIERKPADFAIIIAEALKLLRATVPTSIHIDAKIGPVPPVLADSSQIHQVVTNLVSNAAQAIGNRQGKITVTLATVANAGPGGVIRLSVADTGIGIDEQMRQRIFEPFFTTKEVGQGTGLGLSIIAGIVADHGGRIEVASEPGKGSRFDIDFPALDATSSAAA